MPGRTRQLFLVNALTCGLEVCLATGTVYVPPLLLKAGVEERYMTMVLGVGPVLGLLVVPVLGSVSDGCRSRFGRRRPFIWALSGGVLLGLLLVALQTGRGSHWASLVLAVCLLEFCGQACFTPLEALVSDLFPGEEESHRAFSVYSLMLSLGGCVGYLLPAVDWSGWGAVPYLGGQEAFVYTLLILIFLACLLGTALIREERAGRAEPAGGHRLVSLWRRTPAVVTRLFLAQLCGWMSLMSFMLFYTDFMGEGLYCGDPSQEPGSAPRTQYDEGVRMASLGLFLQCVTSVLFSLLMERLVRRVGVRSLYLSSIMTLSISTAVMTLSTNITLITLMAAATGYTFCTLQILPYTLTCLYHSNTQVFFGADDLTPVTSSDGGQRGQPGVVRERGLGTDIAVLDSAFLLSQVLPSLLLGLVVQIFHSVSAYMASAFALSLVAVFFSRNVVFHQADVDH